ncbi:uncharacterized protein At3g60930, chloroplastic-like [Eutrema salsugineum]|uniref:uncharacterized protein At3g60930, chloroplastic-like n=1 Tax=Eutrema salsugineum TaxID=72664 RepID=UPI000CED1BE0|nr:uncharacterized protein At3g60930, chloroplastic-like [Eutrema salsugineum]
MSSCSDDSLDSLFHYEPSRVDAEGRGTAESSEASVSPSPSNRSSDEASNHASPSDVGSPDGELSVLTSRPQDPVPDEDINRAALKAEEEAFPFDLFEAELELERLMASRGASTSGRGPRVKRQKPDPPGSTLCSLESLEALRHRFEISEAVQFVVPEKSDRADNPPENHFTLYEAFFELCFLWFPIPGVILEYLWKHGISIGQIMPRGLRHMIGILVRSFECGVDIELNHLLNLLEVRKAPKGNRFYISNKAKRRIIGGFPSKDLFWTEHFFYVLVNEASVGENYVQRTKTAWGPLGSRPEALPRLGTIFVRCFLPPIPDDLFTVQDSLSARKVNWRKNFTLERVEKVLAILAGVLVSSSSSSSSRDTREKMVIIALRERKRREEEEAARRAAEAAHAQTEAVQAEAVSAQAEAVPQPDPPSREGDVMDRVAEGNTVKVAEKDAAPEVEPGEIIPEVSGEGSAARSKTPSHSAILALPKSTRPPTSVVQKHDSSSKRSATDKRKGIAVQKDEPSKKRRKPTPRDPAARKLVVDDPDASVVMFSRVKNASTRLPPSEKLRRPRSYGAMAQRGTKFVAAINDLMAEYEADLSKVERRLDEARGETAASKAKLEEAQNEATAAKGKLDEAMSRVSRLEEEKIVLRANVDKVSASVIRLEEARRAKSAEVALLKRRIEAKDALFDVKVKRAKKEARREVTAKFQERLAKVEEGLAKLEKAKNDENDLGQIKGNLAMIAVLKRPDAPMLDDEEAQLKSWESEYADDDAYERIASEIQGELVFSPVSPDSVDTNIGNEPLEETAANLGVVDPNGSNGGTPVLSNLLAERETQSAA